MPAPRQTSVRISDEARRGLDRLATSHGVTLTALLEALGRQVDSDPEVIPSAVIDEARRIDFERRSRQLRRRFVGVKGAPFVDGVVPRGQLFVAERVRVVGGDDVAADLERVDVRRMHGGSPFPRW